MMRALLRIMKGNGLVAGFFIFLAVGFVFPALHSRHEHGLAVAALHQHSHDENAAAHSHAHGAGNAACAGHASHHGQSGSHSTPASCNDDCCAPGCCALPSLADAGSYAGSSQTGRYLRPEDRRLSGLPPPTAERPPRA